MLFYTLSLSQTNNDIISSDPDPMADLHTCTLIMQWPQIDKKCHYLASSTCRLLCEKYARFSMDLLFLYVVKHF